MHHPGKIADLHPAFRGGYRCEDGRLMEHRPQHDDPYYEQDIGECADCEGRGCENKTDQQ